MRKISRRAFTALAVVAPMLASGALAADARLPVTIDASRAIGRLKPLDGVNGPPVSQQGADLTGVYKGAGIGLVRIHDAGAGDIDAVYTTRGRPPGRPLPPAMPPRVALNASSIFLDAAADPDNPASYNFGPTDRLIEQIRASGAEPLFRLGRSAGADPDVPSDFEKYAKISARIVQHYNQGWANGFRYGIRYWEVWNEPDFSSFWQGQPEEYYAFYAKVATAVKVADPTAMVGGPSSAWGPDERPYGREFIEYAKVHKLPLDFYAWHWYSANNDPYDYARIGQTIRGWLDDNGFDKTISIVDEWNSSLWPGHGLAPDSAQQAAFVGSALAYMEDGPVDQQAIYRADDFYAAKSNKTAQTLSAWLRLKKTPLKLKVKGSRTDGFAVVAGRSEDGQLTQVFVSNYDPPAVFKTYQGPKVAHVSNEGNFLLPARQRFKARAMEGYNLTLTGLGPGRQVLRRYRLSEEREFELVETRAISGSRLNLSSDLKVAGVEFLEISRAP